MNKEDVRVEAERLQQELRRDAELLRAEAANWRESAATTRSQPARLQLEQQANEVEARAAQRDRDADLLASLTQERDEWHRLHQSMTQTAGEALARAESLQRELSEARTLLNPTCAEETLCGAIRNLQQAYLSEKGNAEAAESALTTLRQQHAALRQALLGAQQFLTPGIDRGPAIKDWENTISLVEAALASSSPGTETT